MRTTTRISWQPLFSVVLALLTFGVPILEAASPIDPLASEWIWYKGNPVTFKADGTLETADGTRGTWEFRHNSEAQRHYRVVWERGKFIDDVVLSENGQSAHVTNVYPGNNRLRYDVRRAIPDKPAASPTATPHSTPVATPTATPVVVATPASTAAPTATPAVAASPAVDPFPGVWRWRKQGLVTFNADGTIGPSQSPLGTWEFQRGSGVQRQYLLIWGKGKYVDKFTMAADGQRGHIVNVVNPKPPKDGNLEYDVQRAKEEAKPTEAAKPGYFGAP